VHECEKRRYGRTDPKYPGTGDKVWLNRHSPKGCGKQDQNGQADPLEDSASPRKFMGIMPAFGTIPVLPETTWQERYPENVTHIKSANLFSSTLLAAAEAVVVAKRDTFRPPMVDTIDDKHFHQTPMLRCRGLPNWQTIRIPLQAMRRSSYKSQ
jgi:hypothetical protein